ncbi:MAG TPA: cystathionine gamma-synthase [Hellea balneolensis]|uniref:Cystathionine gamma-synthase n=1 Tax=Hellea balneolensis TaxID=287478 RepID=A0A7C5LVJ6_9PROT|nr:cystathionine gamma-synthase [Hellea balneolensis]
MLPKPPKAQTRAVNAQIGADTAYGAVVPPLYLSTTYKFPGFENMGVYDYGRGGNPTRDALGDALARLENGYGGVVTASGMAAIDLTLNLLPGGSTVIAPHDCYGGTYRLFEHRAKQGRIQIRFIDQNNEDALQDALAQDPDMVFIETPSNPLMRLVDIKSVVKRAKRAGAFVVCDNTFLSPARQTPLDLGADIVVHSNTKYINGHSDVIGGVVVAKTQTRFEDLSWWANCTGVTGAPFDSYQTLRGLRTLFARMDAQEKSALRIAQYLEAHDKVRKVYYPGLATHPQYELAQTQQTGPGAMLSFELETNKSGMERFFHAPGIFQFAESLGGTESLICHPATMTHRAMNEAAQIKAGIQMQLVRLSVGLEHTDDLITSLKTMLEEI